MLYLSPPHCPNFNTRTDAGRAAAQRFASNLTRYKSLADDKPLSSGFRFLFSSSLPGSTGSGRPLSTLLLQPGTWSLTLERPLKDRPSSLSSGIWTARVGLLDHSHELDCDPRPVVVVKFIQPSLLPHPEYEEGELFPFSDWRDKYESPDWTARLGSASYDRLDPLQGTTIPYFFGKDIVRSPYRWELELILLKSNHASIGYDTLRRGSLGVSVGVH